MASASTMLQHHAATAGRSKPPPPPPRPPKGPPPPRPPPPLSSKPQSSSPPKSPQPPPPPPKSAKRANEVTPLSTSAAKRAKTAEAASSANKNVPTAYNNSLSFMSNLEMRDVNVFNKKHQVGQGTYGSVFVGQDKITNEIVALKRINTKQEENGFPITAIREVKILKALNHPNIVKLKEIVTSKEQGEIPKNVFMVFEYLEYDLTGILDTPEIRFTQDHVKSWCQQLLSGVHYMHTNKVIHRDLKASNLLVNRKGELKIADWGLARSWSTDMKRLTNKVITLWYRPPELLLGCLEYTDKVDMWSVGCIVAEMFRRSGFLKGANEATQLDLIFRTCGHPTKEDWPEMVTKCRLWKEFGPSEGQPLLPNRLEEALKCNVPLPQSKWLTKDAVYFISKMLTMNPEKRWSAEEALDADYFFENPIVKPIDQLTMNFSVSSVHEWDCRRRYEQKIAQQRQSSHPPVPAA